MNCRGFDDFTNGAITAAVTRAIPRFFRLVPAHDAAGMAANRRQGNKLARIGAVNRKSLSGKRLAVYRADSGELIALSPVCSHAGCIVSWNEAEKTWDCPCHGSRYSAVGEVIEAPAIHALKKIDISN